MFDSGKYAEYLKVMSRFPTYSVNNQMLIRLQRPNATKVAGYNKWQQLDVYKRQPQPLPSYAGGAERRVNPYGFSVGCHNRMAQGASRCV